MNKDKIGLIKYISILVAEMFLPLIWILLFFLALGLEEYNSEILIFTSRIVIIIFCLTPIMYLFLPIIATIMAIRHRWSSYLDIFFNQLKYPTFIFIMVLFIIFIYKHFDLIDGNYNTLFWYFYYSIILPYCLIYIVILVHNICRKYPNQCKKLKIFINKFGGINNG